MWSSPGDDAALKNGELANSKLGSKVKILIPIMFLFFASGCATPITKAERTPVFFGKRIGKISISVVDNRSFILSGDKEEWFEGIARGSFAVPLSLKRTGGDGDQPFAIYFAKMLRDSFSNAGMLATIVPMSKGSNLETTIQTLKKSDALPVLIVMMNKSRYDAGISAEYNYHFELMVFSQSGDQLASRSFQNFDTDIPLSSKYTIPDMYAEIYRKRFELFLKDPEIKAAIEKSLTS